MRKYFFVVSVCTYICMYFNWYSKSLSGKFFCGELKFVVLRFQWCMYVGARSVGIVGLRYPMHHLHFVCRHILQQLL